MSPGGLVSGPALLPAAVVAGPHDAWDAVVVVAASCFAVVVVPRACVAASCLAPWEVHAAMTRTGNNAAPMASRSAPGRTIGITVGRSRFARRWNQVRARLTDADCLFRHAVRTLPACRLPKCS